uniref:Uncharacterized protein n=1 Tax=Schizaphis graminum TaxID=13262 RepID=A0A2S2PBR6_SCHGA
MYIQYSSKHTVVKNEDFPLHYNECIKSKQRNNTLVDEAIVVICVSLKIIKYTPILKNKLVHFLKPFSRREKNICIDIDTLYKDKIDDTCISFKKLRLLNCNA